MAIGAFSQHNIGANYLPGMRSTGSAGASKARVLDRIEPVPRRSSLSTSSPIGHNFSFIRTRHATLLANVIAITVIVSWYFSPIASAIRSPPVRG
jgi:hypothetical protein